MCVESRSDGSALRAPPPYGGRGKGIIAPPPPPMLAVTPGGSEWRSSSSGLRALAEAAAVAAFMRFCVALLF